jgi:outer membrane receptor for ferrienterochelin and colicins
MDTFHTTAGGRVRIYGEPTLKPQQSWSSHASALFNIGSRSRLETQLFYHDMSDLIQTQFVGREGTASVYRYRNVGQAMIRGGSTSITVTPSRPLELIAGYQYLDTLNRDASTPLAYAPRHRGNFRLTYAERRLGLLASFFGNMTSRTYFGLSGTNRVYMNGFELFGANIQKQVTRRVGLRLTLRNLTNNVDPAYRLTAPVSVESSLRIQLGRVE